MRNYLSKWMIAAIVLSLLIVPNAQSQGGVRVTVDQVSDAAFPAMDTVITVASPLGVPILGLTPNHFQLLEDGKPVSVGQLTASTNPQVKIAVAVAIDASGSMVGEPFEDAREAATTFLDNLGVWDEAAVLLFASKVDLGEPFPVLNPQLEEGFTTDKGKLKNLLIQADAVERARTPLYDAAFKAIRMATQQPVGRRAVILFTDGNERETNEKASVMQADDPITEATKYGIPVFTIGLGPDADTDYLQRMALMTGGTFTHTTESGQLAPLFQEIADRLKQEYRVSWTSNTPVDYAQHQGLVKVSSPIGESEASFSFTAIPAGVWVRQLQVKSGEETKPLEDGQTVTRAVTVQPEVYTRNTITKVEYYVDDQLEYTSQTAPFTFSWDTTKSDEGPHTLRAVAYDDAGVPQAGERVVNLTVRRAGIVPEWMPSWGLPVGALALIALIAAIVLLSRKRQARICPVCGREMDPSWTECLFCATEQPTAVPVGAQGAPAGVGFQPITSVEQRPVEGMGTPPGMGMPEGLGGMAPTAAMEPGYGPAIGSEGARGAAPDKTMQLKVEPKAMAWLIVEKGERAGKTFPLQDGVTSIGRAGDNDIIISDPTASRQQARVKLEGKFFYIYDLAATNPTLVNGKEITKHKLEEGDRVQIGTTVLVFKRL